jgi:hypothetical protein
MIHGIIPLEERNLSLLQAERNWRSNNEPTFIDVPTKSELEEIPPEHRWQAALQQERR